MILFNGKEISYKDLDKIDEKTISSSGNSGAKHAVKKYGDKAKNGVIFINTKEYDMENNPMLKEMYEKVGKMKSNMKLTFGYELFLRMTHNSAKILTIPKIGYKHSNLREGSIFWNYKNGQNRISDDEVAFWIESAKKEHFFTSDRNIKYEDAETID